MIKPDSVLELSVQLKLIWLEEAAVALRLEGAAGRAGAGLPACRLAAVKELSRKNKNSTRNGTIMRRQRLNFDRDVVDAFPAWLEQQFIILGARGSRRWRAAH